MENDIVTLVRYCNPALYWTLWVMLFSYQDYIFAH